MDWRLAPQSLRCVARTHATLKDEHYLWIRCRDRRCPDVQQAVARGVGEKVFHVWDLESRAQWTEFVPVNQPDTPGGASHGRHQ